MGHCLQVCALLSIQDAIPVSTSLIASGWKLQLVGLMDMGPPPHLLHYKVGSLVRSRVMRIYAYRSEIPQALCSRWGSGARKVKPTPRESVYFCAHHWPNVINLPPSGSLVSVKSSAPLVAPWWSPVVGRLDVHMEKQLSQPWKVGGHAAGSTHVPHPCCCGMSLLCLSFQCWCGC